LAGFNRSASISAFVWGVGPRIEKSGAPYEDVKLKKP